MEQMVSILSKVEVHQLLMGLAILVVGIVAVRLVMRVIGRLIDRVPGIEPSLHSMLRAAVRFVLDLVVILTAASSVGIPITSFLAMLSVVSLAVSLAVQGILNNLAGGIIILASRPFTLGDYIESDGIAGTVKEIGILHTRLLTPDGKQIFVPNDLLYTSRVVNYSANDVRRVELEVAVSYDTAPALVREAALAAIGRFPSVRETPAPEVLLDRYGENAIHYLIRAWVPAGEFLDVRFALNEALYETFSAHGVKWTYPHVNVHMD